MKKTKSEEISGHFGRNGQRANLISPSKYLPTPVD